MTADQQARVDHVMAQLDDQDPLVLARLNRQSTRPLDLSPRQPRHGRGCSADRALGTGERRCRISRRGDRHYRRCPRVVPPSTELDDLCGDCGGPQAGEIALPGGCWSVPWRGGPEPDARGTRRNSRLQRDGRMDCPSAESRRRSRWLRKRGNTESSAPDWRCTSLRNLAGTPPPSLVIHLHLVGDDLGRVEPTGVSAGPPTTAPVVTSNRLP